MRAITKVCALAGFTCLVAGHSVPALALSKWDAGGGATTSISFTDNVCLDNGGDKVGWVTTFTPRVSVSGSGRNSNLNINGSLALNSLTNSALKAKGCSGRYDDRNNYNPQLLANFQTKLVPGLINLNAGARVGQNEVSSRFRDPDEFNRNGNDNTFYRYWIRPTIYRRIGGVVKVNGTYAFDQVYNTNDFAVDSDAHRVSMSIRGARTSPWSPGLSANHRIIKYDENFLGETRDDREYGSARASLGYRFGSKFSINGSYGYDWSNFRTFRDNDNDDKAWNLSMRLAPSPRTSIALGMGGRFFGNTPSVNIQHANKRSNFRLNYDKTIRFERDLRTDDIGGLPGDLENVGNPSIYSSEPIIDERVTAGWVYRGNTRVSLTGNYSEQTRREDGEASIFKRVSLTLSPRTSSVYRYSSTISWHEDIPRDRVLFGFILLDDPDPSESWTYSLRVSRSLGRRASGSLVYRFADRKGTRDFDGYQENRITASFSFNF